MKTILHYSTRFIAIALVALIASATGVAYYYDRNNNQTPEAVEATSQQDIDIARQINGVNVLYYHPELEGDLQQYNDAFVDRLARLGTTDIAIAIPFFMESNTDSTVATTAETPSVEEVEQLITSAKSVGIKPSIKPLVDGVTEETFARHAIVPDDIDEWFSSYYDVLLPYIELSNRQELSSFVVGVELSSMQQYGFKWANLIKKVRDVHTVGDLTYAINWDAIDSMTFTDELDYVGVDAYFPYDGEINNEDLKVFWQGIFDDLDAVDGFNDEGFVIHEYGIPSEFGAEARPWSAAGVNSVSESLQDIWLRAACDVIHQRSRGGFIWAVYFGTDLDATRQDQKGYNILGKSAVENTVRDCFGWY